MGPNSFRLLDELICRRPDGVRFSRMMDLGCGYALTSLYIADETDAEHVYASVPFSCISCTRRYGTGENTRILYHVLIRCF